MDSGGELPGTGVIATCLWSPAPYLVLATQAPSTESTSGCGRWGGTEGGGPQARLLPLPPACAASVPAVGALTVGEVATLVSLEPFQG